VTEGGSVGGYQKEAAVRTPLCLRHLPRKGGEWELCISLCQEEAGNADAPGMDRRIRRNQVPVDRVPVLSPELLLCGQGHRPFGLSLSQDSLVVARNDLHDLAQDHIPVFQHFLSEWTAGAL